LHHLQGYRLLSCGYFTARSLKRSR